MNDSIKCGNCGSRVHCFTRYCPVCGKAVFTSLIPANAQPRRFFDLMTSLYNLVANRDNPERNRYIPFFSEDTIMHRCNTYFYYELHHLMPHAVEHDCKEEVQDLYTMCLSNSLCGYVFRHIEEFVTGGRSPELTPPEKERIRALPDSNIKKSCYEYFSHVNSLEDRVLFCLGILMSNCHRQYMLAELAQYEEWFTVIIAQSTDRTLEFYKPVFESLCPGKRASQRISDNYHVIRDNVERDFLFGYAVKLGESLDPYKIQASADRHAGALRQLWPALYLLSPGIDL